MSVAGGSVPRGKFPIRPLSVVGGGIIRPLFLSVPNSIAQCTVARQYGICMRERTGPWWSRSSAGCNCSTAQPALGPVCLLVDLP